MIYIHIPFCHRKCTYCAFYSVASTTLQEAYIAALIDEMEARPLHGQPVRTVYIGGGTPSLLAPRQIAIIVQELHSHYDLAQVEEATLEANPEDITAEWLDGIIQLGFFNRLSIGLQSLDDQELRRIGRRHTAQQALSTVARARAAGFENISVDLIYGLPGQTLTSWQKSLDGALSLPVTHLSAYDLTVEENTALHRQVASGKCTLPGEDTEMKMYALLTDAARSHGFRQYEISNFCKPGFASRHNSRYWDRTPYLGLGAAAHSFDGTYRRWNTPNLQQYINQHTFESERLTEADCYNELLMLGLRTCRGIGMGDIPTPFLDRFLAGMAAFESQGWVRREADRFCPTEAGLLHADGMAASLFVA